MPRSAAGSIRRLDDGPANRPGRWQLRYKGTSKNHRGTRRTAAHELALMISTISGRPPTEAVTVAEAVQIRIDFIRPSRSPTTIAEYDRLLDRRIRGSSIEHVAIDRLTAGDLEAFYADLPGPGVTRPVHRLISSALAHAERKGWIDRNVAGLIVLKGRPKTRRRLPPFDKLAQALTESDDTHPDLGCLFRLAAATGMRRGELCGLTWTDLDLKAGTVRSHRAVIVVKGQLLVKDTKTHAERTAEIGRVTVNSLKARRKRADAWAREVGHQLDSDGFLFSTDPSGLVPFNPDHVSAAWRRLAKRHDLAGVRLHDLRHLYATSLLAAGFTIADVAEAVGHSSPAVTASTYVHGTDRRADASKVIEALMAGKTVET